MSKIIWDQEDSTTWLGEVEGREHQITIEYDKNMRCYFLEEGRFSYKTLRAAKIAAAKMIHKYQSPRLTGLI